MSQLAAMEMIFRFSGDGKFPTRARRRRKFGKLYVLLLQIVRSFSICTEKIDYFSGAHFPSGVHKNSDSTCKDTSIKHLKIEIEFSGVGRS